MIKIINKNIKPKKIIAVLLAVFMLASNFVFFNMTVSAADFEITDIEIKGTVSPGSTFTINVKVENNSAGPAQITVNADISNASIISLSSFNDITQWITTGGSEVFTFIFAVDDEASVGAVSQINFTVSEDGVVLPHDIQRKTITVVSGNTPPPTTPATPSNALTMSVSMVDSVQAGKTFEARVTVKNNSSSKIDNVNVNASESSSGIINLTTHNNVSQNINANSSAVYSFYFSVSSAAPSNIYDIKFVVSYGSNEINETRRIRVTALPEAAPAQNPNFEKVSEVHPQRVNVGSDVRIAFRFANMGGPATGVSVKITYPEGVTPLAQTEISAGTMTPGQTYNCYFEFNVTDKAPAGMQTFVITVSSSSGASLVYPIGITFVKPEEIKADIKNPDVNIISMSIPDEIKQGGIFEIKAVIENSGEADVKPENKLQVKIEYPKGISSLSSVIIPVNSLRQNEKMEVKFTARAGDPIDAEFYTFLIHINYNILEEDEKDEKFIPIETKTQYIGLNVLEKEKKDEDEDDEKIKNFSIEASVPADVKINQNFRVTVIVTNNGEETEKNLYLRVTPTAGVENRSVMNMAIPELKPGESITKEVIFYAPESAAGKYCSFEVLLTGKDINDIMQFTGTMVEKIIEPYEYKPRIIIGDIKLPETVTVGDTFKVEITVANTGSGAAENIVLTVNSPDGILNTSSNVLKIDYMGSGSAYTCTVAFFVDSSAGYGFKQFSADISYAYFSNSETGSEKQYFGVTVNSPYLKIESINLPSSTGVNKDFSIEVAIKNTGADTADVILSLAPQNPGLINKTSNTVKIDNIKSGETITKTFIFMAMESAPHGYSAIEIVLSSGKESTTQYSGIIVNNPPKKDENKPDDKSDIPVVIISKFTYTNIGDDDIISENNSNNNINDFDGGNMFGDDSFDIFERTSVIIVDTPAPAIAAPMPDRGGETYSGGYNGGSSGGGTPKNPAVKDSNAVYGGKTFKFTIELLNTHNSVAVKDLKITFSSRPEGSKPGGIFNPKSGSNTFFVEWLMPGQTVEQEIELLVKSDADPDSYGITISLSYKNEDGLPENSEEIINIPVQQEMRFGIGDLPPINDIEMGDEAYITVQFGNLGKSKIYNVAVKVQGDGFMNFDGTHYEGTIDAGSAFRSKEFTLTPFNPGFINGIFIFTYEDADGNVFEEQQPFFFNVIGDDMFGGMDPGMIWGEDGIEYGPDGMPVMNEGESEEESGGFWLFTDMSILKWAIIIGGGLFITGAAAAAIIIIKVKKKSSDSGDDDDL